MSYTVRDGSKGLQQVLIRSCLHDEGTPTE